MSGDYYREPARMDKKTENKLGEHFYQVDNDCFGNPRYVIHFTAFDNDYETAHRIALGLGFSKYRGKKFGGGFVCHSYNLENTAEKIIQARRELRLARLLGLGLSTVIPSN